MVCTCSLSESLERLRQTSNQVCAQLLKGIVTIRTAASCCFTTNDSTNEEEEDLADEEEEGLADEREETRQVKRKRLGGQVLVDVLRQ